MVKAGKQRAAIKFVFWFLIAAASIIYVMHAHHSGQLASWFYYSASTDGYAVNTDLFADATKEKPARLTVVKTNAIVGLEAVPVKEGDLLPAGANGVISNEVLKKRIRAVLSDSNTYLTVFVPWEIQQSKGFKFKDTFKHKGIETYPWGAVWNVLMVMLLGLSLGFAAEGFTDLLGIKLEKIRHFEGH